MSRSILADPDWGSSDISRDLVDRLTEIWEEIVNTDVTYTERWGDGEDEVAVWTESGLEGFLQTYFHPESNYVHIIGTSRSSNSSMEDNDFAIIGWGQSVGTFDTGKEGIIVMGTQQMKDAIYSQIDLWSRDNFISGNTDTARVIYRYTCDPNQMYLMQMWLGGGGITSYNSPGYAQIIQIV